MAKVSFGMFWEVYGRQEIELPCTVNPHNQEEVKAYIESVWDDIPLPEGDYVSCSDEFDEESLLEITYDDNN